MFGLGLCSTYELSFNIEGFIAAFATNLSGVYFSAGNSVLFHKVNFYFAWGAFCNTFELH